MTVTCHQLSKQYQNIYAVKQLSVTFKENSITGLIGRNGAGKTTLLQMIAGFTYPTSGEVNVFGENPMNNLNVSANTIFVDDRMVFPPELTLGDVLHEAKSFYEKWDEELAEKLVNYFSINLYQFHNELSKGKRSTFNMIVGLASKCALTIFDEPTTGMDYSVRQDFYRALLKDYLNHPRTIIISSHLLNEIEQILEEIVLIKDGQLVMSDSVENMKEFAVGLTGKRDLLETWTAGRNIIARQDEGSLSYYVVQNNFSSDEKREMERLGIKLSKVDTPDLTTYLTSPNEGGIDDVFN
ncbi:ATP-binding cassette domain-containing protein [Bacillaceae bacterium W0354]